MGTCKVCKLDYKEEVHALRFRPKPISYDNIRRWLKSEKDFSVSKETLIRHFREHIEASFDATCKVCAAGLGSEVETLRKKGVDPAVLVTFCREKGVEVGEPEVRDHLEHPEGGAVMAPIPAPISARVEILYEGDLKSFDEVEAMYAIIQKRMKRIALLEKRVESAIGPDPKTLKELDSLSKDVERFERMRKNIGEIEEHKRAQLNMILIQQISNKLNKEAKEDLIAELREHLGSAANALGPSMKIPIPPMASRTRKKTE